MANQAARLVGQNVERWRGGPVDAQAAEAAAVVLSTNDINVQWQCYQYEADQ
jgi:hypothetical protein